MLRSKGTGGVALRGAAGGRHGILAESVRERHASRADFGTPGEPRRFARNGTGRYSCRAAATPADGANRPLLRGSTLRIAIVIERFVPGGGGVENVAWAVAHELERQGEDVTILAREVDAACALRSHRVRAPRFWQPLRIPLFSRGCATHLARHDYDVVHGFSHTRTQHLFRAGGGSHRDELRRLHAGSALASRLLSPRHRVRLAIERHVFERTRQRIQCSSRLVADTLEREHGVARERIELVPNAVEATRFASEAARRDGARLRATLAPGAERVWLFPASGWHRKGLDTALAAFGAAERGARRGGDEGTAELWVAGRDAIAPARRRARALGLDARVRFLGERSDMPALYQAADAVLLPTRYDPFANVTLEAAAAGRPIVTSAANGAAEWLGDAIDVVADADDAEGFARAMTALHRPEARSRRGARLARAAAELDWPRHVERLRAIYRRLVAEREGAAGSPVATRAAERRR